MIRFVLSIRRFVRAGVLLLILASAFPVSGLFAESAQGESPSPPAEAALPSPDARRLFLYFGQGVAQHENTIQAPLPYLDPATGQFATAAPAQILSLTSVGTTTLRSRVSEAPQRRVDAGLLWGGWLFGVSYNRLRGDSQSLAENPPPIEFVGGSYARKLSAGTVSYRFRRDSVIQPVVRGTYSRAAVDYKFENVFSYNTATLAYDYTGSLSGQGRVEVYQAMAGLGFEHKASRLRVEPYYRYQLARLRLTVSGPTSRPVLVRESPLLAIPNPTEIAAAAVELDGPVLPVRLSSTEDTPAHLAGVGLAWQPLRFLRFEVSGGMDLTSDATEAAATVLFFFHQNMGLRVNYIRGDSGAGGQTRELTGGPIFTAVF